MELEKSHFTSFDNLETKSLWANLTSNLYNSEHVTVVRFVGKKGFTFVDEGHANRQITIITKGSLKFFVGDQEKVLNPWDFVDIAPRDRHGGEALTDIEGIDIFYPKRTEVKYQ